VHHVASKAPAGLSSGRMQHVIHAEALSGRVGVPAANPNAAHCGGQLSMATPPSTAPVAAAAYMGSLPDDSCAACLQDAWNLRGTFSLSVGVLAVAIIPLFAIFVRYSDTLSYR